MRVGLNIVYCYSSHWPMSSKTRPASQCAVCSPWFLMSLSNHVRAYEGFPTIQVTGVTGDEFQVTKYLSSTRENFFLWECRQRGDMSFAKRKKRKKSLVGLSQLVCIFHICRHTERTPISRHTLSSVRHVGINWPQPTFCQRVICPKVRRYGIFSSASKSDCQLSALSILCVD